MNFEGFENNKPKSNIDSSSPHEKLGISADASASEVKQAYRDLIKKVHPDVGGTVDDFRRVQEAYESIKDQGPRARTGEQRAQDTGNPSEARKAYAPDWDFETGAHIYESDTQSPQAEEVDEPSVDSEKELHEKLFAQAEALLQSGDREAAMEILKSIIGEDSHRPNGRGTDSATKSAQERVQPDNAQESESNLNQVNEFLRKEVDSLGRWQLVDTEGNKTRSYVQIKKLGDRVIGKDVLGKEVLLDSKTAERLSVPFSAIRMENDKLVGVDSLDRETLLDSEGKAISSSYKEIRYESGRFIGKSVLDREEEIRA